MEIQLFILFQLLTSFFGIYPAVPLSPVKMPIHVKMPYLLFICKKNFLARAARDRPTGPTDRPKFHKNFSRTKFRR